MWNHTKLYSFERRHNDASLMKKMTGNIIRFFVIRSINIPCQRYTGLIFTNTTFSWVRQFRFLQKWRNLWLLSIKHLVFHIFLCMYPISISKINWGIRLFCVNWQISFKHLRILNWMGGISVFLRQITSLKVLASYYEQRRHVQCTVMIELALNESTTCRKVASLELHNSIFTTRGGSNVLTYLYRNWHKHLVFFVATVELVDS